MSLDRPLSLRFISQIFYLHTKVKISFRDTDPINSLESVWKQLAAFLAHSPASRGFEANNRFKFAKFEKTLNVRRMNSQV